MRKRKDKTLEEQSQVDDTSRDEGVEITEIEDTSILSITDDLTKEEMIETDDQLSVDVEEVIRKKKKPINKKLRKKNVEEEVEEEEEEEEIELQKSKKVIKPKKSKLNREELSLEEVEELEVVPDEEVSSVILNIPSNQIESIASIAAVDQAPDKPQDETANVSVDSVNALIEQYDIVQEKEVDDVKSEISKTRKASLSITPVEPYSTTEIIVHDRTASIAEVAKPHSEEASTDVIFTEGIIISEVHPNEAKPTQITEKDKSLSKADIVLTLQEAKIISEQTVNEKESSTADYISPATVQAEKTIIPQQGVSVLEVHEGIKEEKLEETKTIANKPKVTVDEIESIQVQEVYVSDKPGKYYPELIVPTEVASTSIIELKPHFTEEMYAPEKEGKYIPGKLPPLQSAETEFSSHGKAAIVTEELIQEKENVYQPDYQVDSHEATSEINLFESIRVSTTDIHDQESELAVEKSKRFNADISMEEQISVLALETTATEKEKPYKPDDKPEMKSAEKVVLQLELGIISSTMVQDSECEYTGAVKPTAAIAETVIRPEEHINVSEIQTADYPEEYRDTLKYVTDTGVVEVETTEAKFIQEIVVHDQEDTLEHVIKADTQHTELTVSEVKSIEVTQTTVGEKEQVLKVQDLPESHLGKEVPVQPVHSFETSETHLLDNAAPIIRDVLQPEVATVTSDNLQGTTVEEIILIESISAAEKDVLRETKKAEVQFEEKDSLHTTEVMVTETESEYESVIELKESSATTIITTHPVAAQEEVRTESPTENFYVEEVCEKNITPLQIPLESITVTVQESAEKEDIYTEDIKPSQKVANLELTEARLGATTLEIVANDREQTGIEETGKPQDAQANFDVTAHSVALQSETTVEQSTESLSGIQPCTSIALSRQEAFEELVITETNIAEAERAREEDVKPKTQQADTEITALENISISELTVLAKVSFMILNLKLQRLK